MVEGPRPGLILPHAPKRAIDATRWQQILIYRCRGRQKRRSWPRVFGNLRNLSLIMSSSITRSAFYLILYAFFLFLPTAVSAQAMGPLTRSASNPNYFARPDGTPVYFVGSHHWSNLQDQDAKFPTAAFDYTSYLNWMQSNNFNFMRLWNIAEQPYSAAWTRSPWYADPLPYARPGPGVAADNKPKFDINTFNQSYFDRLRARVIEAGQHGIYVDVMLFEGWSLGPLTNSTNPWTYHPYNVKNNINGINGDPFNTGSGYTIQTTSEPPAVLAAQHAYVRKVIDTVNDLDNVLYEISNEFPTDLGAVAVPHDQLHQKLRGRKIKTASHWYDSYVSCHH